MNRMRQSCCLFLLLLCGCGDGNEALPDLSVLESCRMIDALKTNVCVRAVSNASGVRTNLLNISCSPIRSSLLKDWTKALFEVRLDDLSPTERSSVVKSVADAIEVDVVGAMSDLGYAYEDLWSMRFALLVWLDGQCRDADPRGMSPGGDWREEMSRWDCYQAVVEYREIVIENLELHGLDDRIVKVGEERLASVREKFEMIIGRAIRKRDEVSRLGYYVKEARARVLNERNEFMRSRQRRSDGRLVE